MAVNVMSWNIQAGGYDKYSDPVGVPPRDMAIREVIRDAKDEHDLNALVLPDAHNWDKTYGGDEMIAEAVGFKAARFTPLDDERLNKKDGEGIGIVIGTDLPVHRWDALDLETRQAASVMLDIGKYGVQLVGLYLDDMYEDVRKQQIRALLGSLDKEAFKIVIGDVNYLRPDLHRAAPLDRIFDRMLRIVTPRAEKLVGGNDKVKALAQFNRREAYSVMTEGTGLVDADAEKCRPTEKFFGRMSIDHAYTSGFSSTEFDVIDGRGASDHSPIVLKAA